MTEELQRSGPPCDVADVILVVEDNPSTGEVLCEILREEGLPSVWARSGQAALDYLTGAPPPCLVLMDLFMPGVSGFDLLERMRATPALRDLPVVVISAADRRATERARQLHPGVVVVPKPLDLDFLLEQVRACGSR